MPWKDGQWVAEDDSVATQVSKLQSQDSALMRQSSAAGLRTANRRGLINSSMGVGAGVSAALGAVTPIASQDAESIKQKNMQGVDHQQGRMLTAAQIAAQDRQTYANSMNAAGDSYITGIGKTLENDKIPSSTRAAVQGDIAAIYKQQQAQLAAIYGSPALSWGAAPAPAPVG